MTANCDKWTCFINVRKKPEKSGWESADLSNFVNERGL